jgi:DNA-binding NarL/FixJ family response regulator
MRCRRRLITPAEQRILEFVAQGYTNRQIALAVNLSYKTVSLHRSRVMRKLGLRSPCELRRFAEGYLKLRPLPGGADASG